MVLYLHNAIHISSVPLQAINYPHDRRLKLLLLLFLPELSIFCECTQWCWFQHLTYIYIYIYIYMVHSYSTFSTYPAQSLVKLAILWSEDSGPNGKMIVFHTQGETDTQNKFGREQQVSSIHKKDPVKNRSADSKQSQSDTSGFIVRNTQKHDKTMKCCYYLR